MSTSKEGKEPKGFQKFWIQLISSRKLKASQRLANNLPQLVGPLEYYKSLDQLTDEEKNWIKGAERKITEINQARLDLNAETGWKIYKQLRRELLALDYKYRKAYCINEAMTIFYESNKKIKPGSWRIKTINSLLAIPDPTEEKIDEIKKTLQNPEFEDKELSKKILDLLPKADEGTKVKNIFNPEVPLENIVYAAKILDEYQDNFYGDLEAFNNRIRMLGKLVFASLLIWILFAPNLGHFPNARDLSETVIEKQAEAFWEAVRAKDSIAIQNNAGQDTLKPTVDTSDSGPKINDSAETQDTTEAETVPVPVDTPSVDTPEIDSIIPDTQETNESLMDQPLGSADKDSAKKGKPGKEGTTPDDKKPKPGKADDDEDDDEEGIIAWWKKNYEARRLSLFVILTGFIGSLVSAFLRSIKIGEKAFIPNKFFGRSVMNARLMLSTASALAIYIFLSTGIIFVFQGPISFELLLTFAFVAGFSERLILRSVEKLTKEELYMGRKKD